MYTMHMQYSSLIPWHTENTLYLIYTLQLYTMYMQSSSYTEKMLHVYIAHSFFSSTRPTVCIYMYMLCVLALDFILISPLNSYSHKLVFLIVSELKYLSVILLKRAERRKQRTHGAGRSPGNREDLLACVWYYIELASRPPRQLDAIFSSPAECAPEHTHCEWPSPQHCSTTE